jgi:tetratricopeptide (TPR) repeat protein
MLRSCLAAVLLITSALSTAAAAAADYPLPAPAGAYPVGFHVRQQFDRARVYLRARDPVTAQPAGAERARPLQTLVWYPAGGAGAPLRYQPMTYRDYVATVATEEDFRRTPEQVRRATDGLLDALTRGADGARIEAGLRQPVRALRDAAEQPGSYPVVIYAPGNSAYAIDNADLCEYLASQGYIVIASASLGPRSHRMTADLEGAEAQAADISYLVGYAHTLPQADTRRIGVIGHGWGGLAGVLAAARDDRIRALVSLDGALRAAVDYLNGGPRAARYVVPERLGIPLLYISRLQSTGPGEQDDLGAGTDLLARLRYADVYLATMDTANHTDFSSWSLRMASGAGLKGRTREQAAQAYGATARTIGRFLDARLKEDRGARGSLDADLARSATGRGTPPGMLSFALRRAAGPAPTMDTFLDQLGKQGFGRIDAIYDGLHAQNPELSLDALQIRDWGLTLLQAGSPREAIQVFALGVHLYPDRFDFLYDGLGQANEAAGEREAAIAHYQHALELEPEQVHARARLEALGARQ